MHGTKQLQLPAHFKLDEVVCLFNNKIGQKIFDSRLVMNECNSAELQIKNNKNFKK